MELGMCRRSSWLSAGWCASMKEAHKTIIKDYLAKYLIRSSRGSGLVSHVTSLVRDVLTGTVYLFALKGLIGISISPLLLPPIVIIKKILDYIIGLKDEKKGFFKRQNEYSTEELNPYFKKLRIHVENTEAMVQKLIDMQLKESK